MDLRKNVHWAQNVHSIYSEILFEVHFATANIKLTAKLPLRYVQELT
jgi:hypothetical protein